MKKICIALHLRFSFFISVFYLFIINVSYQCHKALMKRKGKRNLKKFMFDHSKNFTSVFIKFPLIGGQKPE